jgi:hypothetical protein
MDRNALPAEFCFALMQNPDSMKKFSNLPEGKQTEILQRARSVSSKDEMQTLVEGISALG